MNKDISGSPGMRLGALNPHSTIADFKEGYLPHVMCTYGAMCEQCKENLKTNE